jgi:iron-sulfur cluster repair protein YtfE (RIC family)
MDSDETIPNVMKRHHRIIEGLLNELKKSEGTRDSKLQIFHKFKWELEKHFFIEEKAIFFYINTGDKESSEMKAQLMKEHDTILDDVEKTEIELKNSADVDVIELMAPLIKHRIFEDNVFYPKLDQELDESKKKKILDRISNPI